MIASAHPSRRPVLDTGLGFSSASLANVSPTPHQVRGDGFLSFRKDFPGLLNKDGESWHYLDTAATAQKPQAVIDATVAAMGRDYATVHRGVYARSADMTVAYEAARRRVASFVGAQENEIVFTRGAT